MPRRRDMSEARTVQVTVAIRPRDHSSWVQEARARKMSLSRLIYIRARAAEPLPSTGALAIAKELGRIGVNLNQVVHLLHKDGINHENIAEVYGLVSQIQERVVNL